MATADQIKAALHARAPEVCRHLFPAGTVDGDEYLVGNLAGDPGQSLRININGKAGVYADFATNQRGSNLLDLWTVAKCNGDFTAAMREAAAWLGMGDDRGRLAGHWTYTDGQGAPWIRVERYDLANGSKRFSQFNLKTGQRIRKGGQQLPTPRPLYGLHRFYGKTPFPIVVVEGEKCVDVLLAHNLEATTTLGGNGQVHLADFSPLAGFPVTLWPDADDAGTRYEGIAAAKLRELGATVRRVRNPDGAPEGWDVADAVRDGWTREQIVALLDTAEPFEPEPEPETKDDRRLYRVVSAREALNLPPVEHRVEGTLPMKGAAVFAGAPGDGKGLVITDLLCSIATRPYWRGDIPVQQAPVALVVAEGWSGVPQRIAALLDYYQVPADADVPLYFIPDAPKLNDADNLQRLLATLDSLPQRPRVVGIDTLARTLRGNENTAEDMGAYGDALHTIADAIDGLAFCVHHTGWDKSRERGNTALRATADMMALVSKEDDVITLACLKAKDSAEFAPLRFRIKPWLNSVVVEPIDDDAPAAIRKPATSREVPKSVAAVMKALANMDNDGATASVLLRVSGLPDRTFYRCLKEATGWGFFEKVKRSYRLTPEGRSLLP